MGQSAVRGLEDVDHLHFRAAGCREPVAAAVGAGVAVALERHGFLAGEAPGLAPRALDLKRCVFRGTALPH